MLVTKETLNSVVEKIYHAPIRGYDTETYGVRYQDRLFSFIVSTPNDDFYFNFNSASDHMGRSPSVVLDREQAWRVLTPTFYKGIWASHNAPFDNQKLRLETGAHPLHCHCTLATERILRNDFLDYSLETVAPRYGFNKDPRVEKYIKEHKLQTRVTIPGKKTVTHVPHYDLVPLEMLVEYGCTDARVHRQIAQLQRAALGI